MEKAVVTYPEKRKRTYIPGSKGMNKQYRATRIAATKNQGIEAVRVKRIDKNVTVGQAVDQRGVPSFAYKIPNGKMYKTAPRADKIPRGGSVPRVVGEIGEQYQDVVGYQYSGNTVIPQYSDNGQPVTGGAAAVAQSSTGTPTFLNGTSLAKDLESIDDEFQNPASKAVYDAHKYLSESNLRQTSISIVQPKESSFAKVAGLVKYLPINYPNADLTEQTRGDAGVSKISSGLRKNYYNQQYVTSAGPPLATHLFQAIIPDRLHTYSQNWLSEVQDNYNRTPSSRSAKIRKK